MNTAHRITPTATDAELSQAIFPHSGFGTIFEVNTDNIGATGIIDGLQSFVPYLLETQKSHYADLLGELLTSSIDVHEPEYYRRYIDSHLRARGRDQLIITSVAFAGNAYAQQPVNRELYTQIAQAYGYPSDEGILFYNTHELVEKLNDEEFYNFLTQRALIISYNDFISAPDTPTVTKKMVARMKWFLAPILLGAGSQKVSSKSWISPQNIDPTYILPTITGRRIDHASLLAYQELCPTHVLKHNRGYGGGKGVYLPGQWGIIGDTDAHLSHLKAHKKPFVLQPYIELPKKLHIDEQGNVVTHQVDTRSFALLHGDRSMHIELFARTNKQGHCCNATSGGSFAPIYVVPDEQYFHRQRNLADALALLSSDQTRELVHSAKTYMQDQMFYAFKDYPLSVVPHIISESAYQRIRNASSAVVRGLAQGKHTCLDTAGNLFGVTQMAIDMAVNPLP